jgi:hypothetical protein
LVRQIVLLKGWHINNDDMTRQAISRSNIVVNLIGSTLETRNFSFDDVHAAWPARLAAMAKEAPKVRPPAGAAVCGLVLLRAQRALCLQCIVSSAWT